MNEDEAIYCPKCGGDSGLGKVNMRPREFILLLAGLFPFFAYYGTRKNLITCGNCGFVFLPTPRPDREKSKRRVVLLIGSMAAILILLGYLLS